MAQTAFRYLHDEADCWRSSGPKACVICGQSRVGYGFIQARGEGYDEHHVCEPCLVSGGLEEQRLHVNDADMGRLRQQLQEVHPEPGEDERQALARERTAEVEQRTPRPAVLNLFTWPAHCGDYCVFFGQADADDLERLVPAGNGKAFLASHLDNTEMNDEFLENVWEDRLKGFMRFYLWQCSQCHEHLLTCDSD